MSFAIPLNVFDKFREVPVPKLLAGTIGSRQTNLELPSNRILKERSFLNNYGQNEKEIDLFFEGFAPLLNFENINRIQVGRQLWIDVTKSNQPIGHFLYNLFMLRTGQRKAELLITLDNEGKKLKDIDPCNIHLMFGALEHDCNILLTANVDDFPKMFGNVEVVRPSAFYEYLINKL